MSVLIAAVAPSRSLVSPTSAELEIAPGPFLGRVLLALGSVVGEFGLELAESDESAVGGLVVRGSVEGVLAAAVVLQPFGSSIDVGAFVFRSGSWLPERLA